MKTIPQFRAVLISLGVLMAPVSAFAQLPTPKTPKVPSTDSITKKTEAAEKAEAAQRSAEKAEAARKAAEKAEAAKKSADKAAAAQQAAEKATAAQKAAEKASSAQNAAEKAATAQKSVEKATAAQKSSEKASAAQKNAEKASAAQKTVDKATKAAGTTEKAAARQAAIEKLNAATAAAEKAEAAKKASDAAAKSAGKTPPQAKTPTSRKDVVPPKTPASQGAERAAAEVISIRALDQATANSKIKNAGVDDSAAKDGGAKDSFTREEQEEARRIVKDNVRDGLSDLAVAPEVANKLAEDIADPDKGDAAKEKVREISGAAADLQLVSVDEAKQKEVIDAVSRSDDPKGTANEKVGEAATEEFFGKDVASKVPPDKRKNFRDVFRNLADLEGSLEEIGGNPDDPEVKDAINEGAERGITTKEEGREILERAGQKVLDRQGFSPAKEGESLKDRLDRIGREQEAEEAARKAKEAARLAKAKIRRGVPPGAAGSTAAGRSVSARVDVAVGGGKGTASGAGSAAQGTGTDASKTTGSGGSFRSDVVNARLPADRGGTSSVGGATTGKADQTSPGAATPPAATAPVTAPGALDPGTGIDNTQTPATTPATSNTNSTETTGTTPTSSAEVSSPTDEIVVGGGQGSSFGGHFQSEDGNSGGDLTFKPDGTFSGTITTVTRDANGNVTSSTTTAVVGTWGTDANGNVVVTTATTAPSQSGGTTTSTTPAEGEGDGDGGGDDDKDDDGDDGDDDNPPPAETAETSTEEAPAETTTETTPAAGSTPNPLDETGGNPMELSNRTGGRLGGQEAKNQKRGLDLARGGGGAAGPNPDGASRGPTLLTPEEQAAAARLLGIKRGGGVTNPNPLADGGTAVTDRDLKELHLRGSGGAKGPTDPKAPAQPQDPKSPIGGTPAPVPLPGNRVNSAVVPAVNVDSQRIKVDPQVKESVR